MKNFTPQESRKRLAAIIAIVLLVALAAFDIFSTLNYLSQPSTTLLLAMSLSYIATASTAVCTWLIRKDRVDTGIWGLIFTNLIALFLSPFLGVGLGVAYAITAIVVTVGMSQALDPKYVGRANLLGLVFGIAIVLLDFSLPSSNTANANNGFTYIILIFLVVALVFIVARQFAGYNLRNKLLVAFGALFLLGLVIAASGLYGLNRVQAAFENTLAGGVQIQNRSDHLNSELLEARRRENDFLLLWKDEGFETAYQNYVLVNQIHTANMTTTLAELSRLTPVLGRVNLPDYSQNQYVADIAAVYQQVDNYERSFAKVVALSQERGHVDTGLEGEFRRSVQAIEAKIYDRESLDKLVITMLQIRRREKDYLLRGDQQYVDNVHELLAQLKEQVAASDQLSAAEKADIYELAGGYLINFDALVAKDAEIAAEIEVLRVAAANIQGTTSLLEAAGERLAESDTELAEANSAQAVSLSIFVVAGVLLTSISLALILARQITQPVIKLTNTAAEIAAGNFDVQAEVVNSDEIGTLAQTFNIMTERLGAAFEDVRRRAAELATVAEVSTATSTILESQGLLQEVVDLTKERFNLYHSHIYLLDEAGKNLVLTAGAGEPGRIMSAEKRSIPLDREQSLVARAAREGKGVTVNDVTQSPDFLPNPLLPDTRSELAVPMIVAGKVIGVFDVQSDVIGRFTESDINIQTTLAAQVATSVQNVRSFERSKTQADFEAMVNTISQRIQRSTSIEETLQIAVRELGSAIGTARVKANIGRSNGNN